MSRNHSRNLDRCPVRTALSVLCAAFFVLPVACAHKEVSFLRPLPKRTPTQRDLPDANAAILLDEESFKVIPVEDDPLSYLNTYQTNVVVVKILNDRGLDYAEVETPPYFHDPEGRFSDAVEINARTLTPDGKVVLLRPQDVHEVSISKYIKKKVFALPAVEPGSVIQYEYVMRFRGPDLFYVKHLGYEDPAYNVWVYVTLPSKWLPKWSARPKERFGDPVVERIVGVFGSGETMRWHRQSIPAIKVESYMPPFEDLADRLALSLDKIHGKHSRYARTWEHIGKWYREYLEEDGGLRPDARTRSVVRSLVSGEGSLEGKISRIFYYLQEHWDVVLDVVAPSQKADETVTEKRGTSGDIACLLVAMLRAAGIESQPVLLRTRDSGEIDREVPAVAWFNRMVVKVPDVAGRDIWLDPAGGACRANILPAQDQARDALVLSKKEGVFETTPGSSPEDNAKLSQIRLRPAQDGSTEVLWKVEHKGELERQARLRYKGLTSSKTRELVEEELARLFPGMTLREYTIGDVYDFDNLFAESLTFSLPEYGTLVDTLLFLSAAPFCGFSYHFRDGDRVHPVVFPYPKVETAEIHIEVPQGYRVAQLPLKCSIEGPPGRYGISFQAQGNRVLCERSFELRNLRIPVRQYADLKDYLSRISEADSRKIVLVKKRE